LIGRKFFHCSWIENKAVIGFLSVDDAMVGIKIKGHEVRAVDESTGRRDMDMSG